MKDTAGQADVPVSRGEIAAEKASQGTASGPASTRFRRLSSGAQIADHSRMRQRIHPKVPTRDPLRVQVGEPFTSREQIAVALGGNGWRGIDYLAKTRHAVLIASSDDTETYSDHWDVDGQTFWYHGEWHGCGDMTYRGGNVALLRRSGLLLLFVREGGVYRSLGRFECVAHRLETQRREGCGHEHRAIAFALRRVG